MTPHPLIDPADTTLLVVDVQARLVGALAEPGPFLGAVAALVGGCGDLGVPVLASEQVPAKLGATHADVGLPAAAVAKTRFSAWLPEVAAAARGTVIVCGMETHVCVLQTALEALADGRRVYLPADAVAAASTVHAGAAWGRMLAAGAVAGDTTGVLYELMRDAGHPAFAAVLRRVKALT